MLGGLYLASAPAAYSFFDFIPPGVALDLSTTATKISSVTGKDEAVFELTSDEDFLAYKIKAVPDGSSPHTAGTLIESGGAGDAGVPVELNVTGSEILGAGLGEGTHVIKVFVKDASGNWST